MLRRSILITLSLFSVVLGGLALLSPEAAFAARPQDEICQGVGAATGSGCDSGISLTVIVRNVINIFSIIIGIVAVIMIMYGGFRYVTAGSDSGNITNAKHTLLYAIIGLVVAALAQVIVKFVLDNVN